MKKAKILTVLGVMLAMGLTGCQTGTKSSAAPSTPASTPASQPASTPASTPSTPASSAPASSAPVTPIVVPDPDGHKFGADTDVAADATAGTVAYKKAACSENDGFERYKVNQSVVTYAEGSTRKDGTPDGYTKLTSNNQSFSFKFKVEKKMMGKLYLYGCMDGWGSSSNHSAGFYYRSSPNVEIKLNGEVIDLSGSQSGSYAQWFGEDASEEDSSLSKEGYAPVGSIVLNEGVNEIIYKRVQTLNMLIKDFVFVVEPFVEWGPATPVAADATAGTVAYNLYTNRLNGTKKIEVKLEDSMLAEGSENKNDPAGYLKLKSNNQSFGFKFNYGSIAYGELYQRGVMDGWSSNKGKKLFSGGSNGADDFEIQINENKLVVDPDQKKLTFEEAMPGEPDTEKNLSPLTDVLTGELQLKNGVNEFKYTRKASYNLALTHIVIIVKDSDHEHAAGDNAAWLKDAEHHWHVCGHEGCNEVVDEAAHTWVDDDSKTDVPSTETTHGKHYVKCSVCGQTAEQELPLAGHTWGEAQTAINDAVPHECTGCHAKCYELTMGTAGKIKADVSWNIKGIPAGKYNVEIKACASSTTLPQNLNERYQYGFDGTYVAPAAGSYASYGLGTGEAAANAQWSSVICQVEAGANAEAFTVHWIGSGYSCFYVAVRLVAVAA